MPNRRRQTRRRRPRRSQSIVISAYFALSESGSIANLQSSDAMHHRDYRPVSINVQATGSGAVLTFQLLGHDGDRLREFGPFILGSNLSRYIFRWPRGSDWFPATTKPVSLARVKILPCAGACATKPIAYVRLRCVCLLSDYDSGLTNQHVVFSTSSSADSTDLGYNPSFESEFAELAIG